MLSPDYLLRISEGAEEVASQLHTDIMKRIIRRIMLRISRRDDYILTAQDKWAIENLQHAGYLLEDIQKDIANATKMQQTEIAEAMEDAGVKALEYDDEIYRSAGLSPTPLEQSPDLIRLMQRNYEATLGEWSNFTRTTAEEAQRLFVNQLDRYYNLVATGAMSYTQALKEVINTIVSDGVKVTYPTGHQDTIETATLRAVRTGISQATSQIQMARALEMGVEKALVSSHLGARPTHQVWQGKVFTLDELKSTNDGMPALGTVTGLCGANCRHSWSPWFEGMENPFELYDSEENKKQYDLEQRQRYLERRIRDSKRKTMGFKEAVDNSQDETEKLAMDSLYKKQAAALQEQNAYYKKFCEENGLKPLQDRLAIAKWDRKQAAAARGAAKRYNHEKTLENKVKSDTIKETKLVNTKRRGTLPPAMNTKRYNSMVSGLKKQGVNVIEAHGDDLRYLQSLGAEASVCGTDYILHMGEIPSASALFEEIIHITQNKTYGVLQDSNAYELYVREIIANRKLLKYQKAYGFTPEDTEDIKRNLEIWEKRFKKLTGGDFDESGIDRKI